jgi:crotonobetainyl-CoA:carnitine CoA-transferase CaiB-like acyl-CoA transferase
MCCWFRHMFHKASPPGSSDSYVLPAMLPVLSSTPGSTRWAGPELGQHTEEVLTQVLGMRQEHIKELRAKGAI